ncbi:hypothetical protein [Parasitella parasitica]|uniref:Uncharacterized protein n=1 Tax=Parasitella parasitica TaxID=35722 RepID=A0A0B7NVH7_9FUNG|nr:hypothetical protein [Parasitella parasitica]
MPSGYASNTHHKREQTPKRKRSRSRSSGLDGKDDLNYVDEDSELSSGDDALTASDVETGHHNDTLGGAQHTRKRGRPKTHYTNERRRSHAATPSAASLAAAPPSQSYIPPANPSGYISDHDESGETKVDKYGRLLGGFRDSFVFLKKNVKLIKVHIDNAEKGFLVDSNMLRSTFRTREISVVTARSVYKQFGHRIVRKGRRGRDDYYYTEEVDDEEELQSEEEPISKESSDKPTPLLSLTDIGRNNLAHKPTAHDANVTPLNYLHNAAVSARQFNTSLFAYRRANPTNYDLLTNVYQIPVNRQTLRDTGVVMPTEKKDAAVTEENTLENASNGGFMDIDATFGLHHQSLSQQHV